MTSQKSTTREFRLPFLQGMLPIRMADVPAEIVAGLTFASLAIPEVMGYTKIAGTPVITGLYTILIPMALFALFGSSRHLVVGADSATAAILASGLAGIAATGSSEYVALASLLALLAALLLIMARILGLGFLADFLSRTVLVGFLTGVGIQVALGELPRLLGIDDGGHGTAEKLTRALHELGRINGPTFAVAASVLILIIGCRRISPRIPGPLLAVVGVIAASWAMDLESYGISTLGTIPSGLPTIGLPDVEWNWQLIQNLLPTALSMVVVILAQSAATSIAYAARYDERFDENTDLVGLGLANLGAGLSGTFVVNGSPTKTEMVDRAGGRNQLAQLVTAAVVLVVILFLTGPLALMPQAVLSAVVFMIGIDLIDIRGMHKIFSQARSEFWVALVTAAVVVLVGVEQGVLLAMALSLINHTRRGYRPKNAVLVKADGIGWRAQPIDNPGELEPGLLVYRFSHSMYYANAEQFSREVVSLTETERDLRWFCIDASAIDEVDFSAGQALVTVCDYLKKRGIRLVFVMVEPEVRAELDRYGVSRMVGENAFFASHMDLVGAFHGGTGNERQI
ncbi:STAS domain-containing protein [Stappia sp. GBMRC 2046]|uniref:STAS domain-containing protein n=1 Tax=Stappia sediminis TaxID=2692190 RepID=A0A7X3LR92_9HYPH|nr:SulP family inorganic anion transporter [Stappia sediminis]MXN63618.1 STAS domain-containing protein [Stappia sediminis]